MGDARSGSMGYTGRNITLDGASFPLAPPTATPFAGKTGGIPGRDRWDYNNPFAQSSAIGRGMGSGQLPMSIPWSGAVSSTSVSSVMKRMTSHSLSRAMGRNNVTPGLRTQYTIAYWRAQNPHLDYFNMYSGYIVGFIVFVFSRTEKIPSPFGLFDRDADMLAMISNPTGLDSDGYSTFFREQPFRGFSSNLTLPQLNFVLATISMDLNIIKDSKEYDRAKSFRLTREDILKAFPYDGVIYNQEGGDRTYYSEDAEKRRGVIYNIAQEGVHRNFRNCFGNEILAGTKLWLICKKMQPNKTYKLNPNDSELRRPGLPKEILRNLDKQLQKIHTDQMAAEKRMVWQIVPWFNIVQREPLSADVAYEEKLGDIKIKKYGFAVYIGTNRYRPPEITESSIDRAKFDAYSYIHGPNLEVTLSRHKKIFIP